MADDSDPPRKHYGLKPREFERVNERADETLPGEESPAVDVHALLRANHERRRAAGLEEAPPPAPRRSRRKRDYWLVLIPLDLFFAGVLIAPNAGSSLKLYALAGLVMFTLGFTWVMWFVVDDY